MIEKADEFVIQVCRELEIGAVAAIIVGSQFIDQEVQEDFLENSNIAKHLRQANS